MVTILPARRSAGGGVTLFRGRLRVTRVSAEARLARRAVKAALVGTVVFTTVLRYSPLDGVPEHESVWAGTRALGLADFDSCARCSLVAQN